MIGPTSAHIGEQLGDECRFEGDLFRLHCGHEQAWVPGSDRYLFVAGPRRDALPVGTPASTALT